VKRSRKLVRPLYEGKDDQWRGHASLTSTETRLEKKRCLARRGWKGGKRVSVRNASPIKCIKSKRKSHSKKVDNTAMIPLNPTVKMTAGTAPGSVKMWECRKCNQLNYWNRYSCELC
jgi:hypothetical protein